MHEHIEHHGLWWFKAAIAMNTRIPLQQSDNRKLRLQRVAQMLEGESRHLHPRRVRP